MILEPFLKFLDQPLGCWAANCDADKIPDVAHCNGLLPIESGDQITFFISEQSSDTFLSNLQSSPQLAFAAFNPRTFEGYQFKGLFLKKRFGTAAENELQANYLKKFRLLIGIPDMLEQQYYSLYLHTPSIAITFTVHEVFEQTPKKGTGLSLTNK